MKRGYDWLMTAFVLSFVLFMSLFWVRLTVAIPLAVAVGVAWHCYREGMRRWFSSLVSLVEAHETVAVAGLFLTGFLVRLLWMAFLSVGGLSTDVSDFAGLWQKSQELASGEWPIVKSWMTAVFYGAIIAVFGAKLSVAYLFTILLQLATVFLGWRLVRGVAGAVVAAAFAVLCLFLPNIIVFGTVVATENVYAFFVVAWMVVLQKIYGNRSVLWTVLLGCLCWFALWSRGEGVVLWIASDMSLVAFAGLKRLSVRKAAVGLLVLGLVFAVGATGAWRLNEWRCGDHTFFCTNDNLVPRYMGSQADARGCYSLAIYREFESVHGSDAMARVDAGDKAMRRQWYDFIRRRTAENWSRLTWRQKVALVGRKLAIDWWAYGTMGLCTTTIRYEFVFAPFAVILLGLVALGVFRIRGNCAASLPCGGCFLLVLMGHVCVLMVGEAAARYSFITYWLLPFVACFGCGCPQSPIMTRENATV